jgi:hypothetical protein
MNKLKFVIPTLFLGALIIGGCGCTGGVGFTGDPVGEEKKSAAGGPKIDVLGQDISDIPRYPGSVRITYKENYPARGYTAVDYVTPDSADQVLSFYEAQLPTNGWSYVTRRAAEEISATKEAQEEGVISVLMGITAEDSDDYQGYTEISISRGSVYDG